MDQQTIELMHADIDGELDAAGQEALRQALASSADARREYARLQSLQAMLAAVPDHEPPAGLRDRILAAVRPAPAPARMPTRRVSRAGIAAALAASAAGVVFLLQRNEPLPELDPASLAGTMVRPGAGVDASTWRLQDPAVTGDFRLRRGADGLYMEVDLEASGPLTLEARIDGRPLEFTGLVPIEEAPDSATRRGEGIRLLHSGKHRYAILLRAPAAPGETVELAVFDGERLVGETRLSLGGANADAGN